jgi:F0F1-type ATP synthase, subunit b
LINPANNVINWLLLIALIIYGWNKLVPPMLAARAKSIDDALASAEEAKEAAARLLREQEEALENASKKADLILEEAKATAANLKVDIERQTVAEIAAIEKKFDAAIENQRQLVITEMRTAAAKAAVQLAKTHLETNVKEADRKRLLTEFMQQLDTMENSEGESFAPRVGSVT